MSQTKYAQPQKPLNLVGCKQLAAELTVPVGTIYYWVSRRDIPFIKVGRHLRFNVEDVLNHFRSLQSPVLDCAARSDRLQRETRSLKTKCAQEANLHKKGD
ncbi:MAG: DNA-binding protein [Proteobacteria bacterium]|nr:MAG: DNA-binding protein [Pseudomonadota bacterium]